MAKVRLYSVYVNADTGNTVVDVGVLRDDDAPVRGARREVVLPVDLVATLPRMDHVEAFQVIAQHVMDTEPELAPEAVKAREAEAAARAEAAAWAKDANERLNKEPFDVEVKA